jgi:hypothetical protein
MVASSTISIKYDDTEISQYVIYKTASFEMNANANPGRFSFMVKDTTRSLTFQPGKEVTLTIDGKKLFGGYVFIVKRMFAFPVVDTTTIAEVDARQWYLSGSDYNILFDKLVLNNPDDYTKALVADRDYDDLLIKNELSKYVDVPAGFDWTSRVQRIKKVGTSKYGYGFPTQGTKFREAMEDFRKRTGATYFIDAELRLNFHAVAQSTNPWGLCDRGGVTNFIGARDITASHDGTEMVTDALVWTGNEVYADSESYQPEGGGLFFSRFPDPPANTEVVDGTEVWTAAEEQRGIDRQNEWGRWQYAEHNFGEGNAPDLGAWRAKHIVIGPAGAGGPEQEIGGLGQPLWDIQMTWFGHDVPGGNHIPAGYLTNLILYALGESETNPLVQYLPMRHCTVTFPVRPEIPSETYVMFQGSFGIEYSDHRKLWEAMRKGRRQTKNNLPDVVATQTATSRYTEFDAATPNVEPQYFSYMKLRATRQSPSVYTVGKAYITGTTDVYVNGLQYALNVNYTESNPDTGEITFNFDLETTDQVYVESRAAGA